MKGLVNDSLIIKFVTLLIPGIVTSECPNERSISVTRVNIIVIKWVEINF